jgi:hypothetical protein
MAELRQNQLLSGCDEHNAVFTLLGSQWIPDYKVWFQVPSPTYTRLSDCSASYDASCDTFEGITEYTLPDNPPVRPPQTTTAVYSFKLAPLSVERIKNSCSKLSVFEEAAADIRSNIGGFHTCEETFLEDNDAWYQPLRKLSFEALEEIVRLGRTVPDTTQISGWLNSNRPSDFNMLHDHGNAVYSLVYFVDDGSRVFECKNGCTAEDYVGRASASSSLVPTDAGCLLLRTQLKPFTHQYGFLSVPPTPGTLWVFPGHVAHCVMPRTLSHSCSCESSPRTSVAMNVVEAQV